MQMIYEDSVKKSWNAIQKMKTGLRGVYSLMKVSRLKSGSKYANSGKAKRHVALRMKPVKKQYLRMVEFMRKP